MEGGDHLGLSRNLMNNHVDKSAIRAIYPAKCLFLLHACYIARNFSILGHVTFNRLARVQLAKPAIFFILSIQNSSAPGVAAV